MEFTCTDQCDNLNRESIHNQRAAREVGSAAKLFDDDSMFANLCFSQPTEHPSTTKPLLLRAGFSGCAADAGGVVEEASARR